MIIVTVGMQLGFDRLIRAMDRLAPSLGMEVIAQVGRGEFQPENMEVRISFAPSEFEDLIERSALIVAHAGIGTVLTAQRFAKPVLLFPRRFDHGEHRNDHQVATAKKLNGRPGILIAMDESELKTRVTQGLAASTIRAQPSSTAIQLRQALSRFIEEGSL